MKIAEDRMIAMITFLSNSVAFTIIVMNITIRNGSTKNDFSRKCSVGLSVDLY